MTNTNECAQNSSSINIQDLSHINFAKRPGCGNISNVSQNIAQAPSLTCLSTNLNNSDLLNKFQTALTQNAEAKNGPLGALVANSTASNVQKLVNTVSVDIANKNVNSCIQNNAAATVQNFSNLQDVCNMSDISQALVQNAVANCVFKSDNANKAIAEFNNNMNQQAKTLNSGAASSASSAIVICIMIIAVLIFAMSPAAQSALKDGSKAAMLA
jgi:hypothetical protein